jgi:hypothetical protein
MIVEHFANAGAAMRSLYAARVAEPAILRLCALEVSSSTAEDGLVPRSFL